MGFPRLLALGLSALLAAGCAKDNTAGPDLGSIQIRYVHAIADTGALDARVNGVLTASFTAVAYGAATPFASFTNAEIRMTSQPAPSTSTSVPRSVAGLSQVRIANGAKLTVVASGEARDTVSLRASGLTAYIDDASAPAAGQSRLRVINASPDAGAVDVYLTPSGSTALPPAPALAGIDSKSATATTVPPGSYTVSVTTLSDRGTVLTTTPITLVAGGAQTIVVRGFAGTRPFNLPVSRAIGLTTMVDRTP